MRKGWRYFSGRLRAFLRKTRLFRWSSFDCRDLYERPDQISSTPIRLGIGSAGCAPHSSANLGKSNFPTMFFSHSRHLCLPILYFVYLSPSFSPNVPNRFGIRVSKTCVPKVSSSIKINTGYKRLLLHSRDVRDKASDISFKRILSLTYEVIANSSR